MGKGALRAERANEDRRVVSGGGKSRRPAFGSALRRGARMRVLSTALVAFAISLVAAASASAFSAHGSAEQVYATGLAPSAGASLLNHKGEAVQTQNADSL